jgi:hypothetical protein
MAIAPAITHIKATGLGTAADGTGTLLAMDASGNVRKAGGTTTNVAAFDTFVNSKGAASGLATLDGAGQVPTAQLGNAYAPPVTKGILTTGNGSTSATLAPGTDKQVLTADPTAATGLAYKQVDHADLTNKGANTHAQIDAFVTSKGQASGLATLDSASKVPAAQLPAPTLTLPGALIGATRARQTVLGTDAAKNIFDDGVTYCTAIGTKALRDFQTDNVTLGINTAVGDAALLTLTAGFNNTAVGAAAGNNLTTGNNNTFLGYNANTSVADDISDSIALGSGAVVDADGQLAIPTTVTHAKADGLATAADGAGTLLAVDASGYIRKAGGASNTTPAAITASIAAKEDPSNKNVAGGYAGLDGAAKVLPANLPDASTSAIGGVTGVTSASNTALGSGAFNATATGLRNVAVGTGPLAPQRPQPTTSPSALWLSRRSLQAAPASPSDRTHSHSTPVRRPSPSATTRSPRAQPLSLTRAWATRCSPTSYLPTATRPLDTRRSQRPPAQSTAPPSAQARSRSASVAPTPPPASGASGTPRQARTTRRWAPTPASPSPLDRATRAWATAPTPTRPLPRIASRWATAP